MLLRAHPLLSFLHVFNGSGPGRPAPPQPQGPGSAIDPAADALAAVPARELSIPPEGECAAARFRGEDGMALLSALAG